jgi:short-subunit dehydrogenase
MSTEFFETNGPQAVAQVLPEPFWKSPDQVARCGIDGLAANRRVVIPGTLMRTAIAASELVPAGMRLRSTERLLRRRRAQPRLSGPD